MTDGFRNTTATVNTTGTTPLGAEIAPNRLGRRISIYLKNISSGAAAAAIITVYFGENIVSLSSLGGGYILDPKGYVMDSSEDKYKCWQGAIRAVSDTDGATLAISERTEV